MGSCFSGRKKSPHVSPVSGTASKDAAVDEKLQHNGKREQQQLPLQRQQQQQQKNKQQANEQHGFPEDPREQQEEVMAKELPVEEFSAMTCQFSEANLLFSGASAFSFRARMDGRDVVVKCLRSTSLLGQEFLDGVAKLSQLRHECVTELLAFCQDGNRKILAFEYAPMGSLHDILHGSKRVATGGLGATAVQLLWAQRMGIALQAARGLEYLHTRAQPVAHKALTSSNILLFEGFKAKVADISITNDARDQGSFLISGNIMGSDFVYNAPEYTTSMGELTRESDVYSFGVVMLELLTGRKPVLDGQTLTSWATQLIKKGKEKDVLDPMLPGEGLEDALTRFSQLACQCLKTEASRRPAMSVIVRRLNSLAQG